MGVKSGIKVTVFRSFGPLPAKGPLGRPTRGYVDPGSAKVLRCYDESLRESPQWRARPATLSYSRTGPGRKKAMPRDPVASGQRDAAQNRVASHNYFLLEKFEAGVALRGTEVKSIREGKANLKDSYGLDQGRGSIFAQRAYRSLFPRKYRQPRRNSGPESC